MRVFGKLHVRLLQTFEPFHLHKSELIGQAEHPYREITSPTVTCFHLLDCRPDGLTFLLWLVLFCSELEVPEDTGTPPAESCEGALEDERFSCIVMSCTGRH